MLQSAQLLDLRNLQVLAQVSYAAVRTEDTKLDAILGQFYEVFEEYSADNPFVIDLDSRTAYVSPLSENMVLICLAKKEPKDEDELHRVIGLSKALAKEYDANPNFEAQAVFARLADEYLLHDILLLFFSSSNPVFQNRTGNALKNILEVKPSKETASTAPLNIGPYRVRVKIMDYDDSIDELSQPEKEHFDCAAIVYSSSEVGKQRVSQLAHQLHSALSVPLLIVPGSDKELQACREFEETLSLMLCDSVSENPAEMLLSVMAIAGFTDSHPELVMKRWKIEPLVQETKTDDRNLHGTEPEGHQEFLVINKDVAETLYAYLYEDTTEHQRAPNVIAAISSFRIDQDSAETFVIRTGKLGYAIVEQEGLLFTLITGLAQNLDQIRSQFAKLPALYLEDPPPPLSNPKNLYGHPPFTLKLLATIPPYPWPSREIPIRAQEPNWERFRYPMMKDFLHTVWDSINGEASIGNITMGTQSKMTVGALYFLRRLGAVDTILRISPDDVPILMKPPDDEFMRRYSELQEVLAMINGEHSLTDVAETTNIEISILMHLFKQMHKRGFVDFAE